MTSKPSPHSGDDTFDLIDDALATLADRRGIWLGDDLATMTLVASLIEQAERCLPQIVHNARANGRTWHEIAHALGTSPDDARLRFDPESPIADSRWLSVANEGCPSAIEVCPGTGLCHPSLSRCRVSTDCASRTWLAATSTTMRDAGSARPGPQDRLSVENVRPAHSSAAEHASPATDIHQHRS